MDELRTIVITAFGALFSLLAPIQYFMYAMVLLFFLNFVFGLAADIINGGKWENKKALMFFVTACSAFVIGHFMGEHEQAIVVVKFLCYIAIYVFGTNIFRNLRDMSPDGSQWYRFFDLCYYILSVQFLEKIPIIKKWQEEKENRSHRTVLQNDNF